MQISDSTGKPLMLFFTGSDWCIWCIRLQKAVFSKPKFATWAKENVVLVEIDFPKKTKLSDQLIQQNNSLKNYFKPPGYPTVYFAKVVKDTDGKIQFKTLGQIGGVDPKRCGNECDSQWITTANQLIKAEVK